MDMKPKGDGRGSLAFVGKNTVMFFYEFLVGLLRMML